jgi:hypothetical protein
LGTKGQHATSRPPKPLFIYIKTVYYWGDMFRPSLGHLQALKEHISKIIEFSYINALWDPKWSQNVITIL